MDETFDGTGEVGLAIYCMDTSVDNADSESVNNNYDDGKFYFGKVFVAILGNIQYFLANNYIYDMIIFLCILNIYFTIWLETLLLKFREIFDKEHIGPCVTFAMYFLQQYCLTDVDLFLKSGLRKLVLDYMLLSK